jgi:hypothetical protein
MADERECFTVLEKADGSGEAWKAQQEGDSITSVEHAPAVVAKDKDDQYALIQIEVAGEAPSTAIPTLPAVDKDGNLIYLPVEIAGEAPGNLVPVAPAVDKDGNLIQLPVEIAGEAPGNANPVLPALDSTGNLAYLNLNSDGELLVSTESAGTELRSTGIVTAVVGTPTTIVDLTLTISEIYENMQIRGSNMFATKWEFVQVNDAVLTVVDSFLTGPGQFSFSMDYKHMTITAGGSGTQKLRLRATQLIGAASDCHGYIECIEKA